MVATSAFISSPLPTNSRATAATTPLSLFEPSVPNFCADCGNSEMVLKIPEGDERLRACCNECGRIEYSNPKIVAACVVRTTDDDRILLAKRAIEPRKGTWGIPQGYMEHGETSRQAAVREVYEETGAVIDPDGLMFRAVYNVPGSVQLVYEARVEASSLEKEIEAYNEKEGGESLEVALLSEEALAEKEICFPTVLWALDHCRCRSHSAAEASSIQQMTKTYDPETEVWSQYEDEESKAIRHSCTASNM